MRFCEILHDLIEFKECAEKRVSADIKPWPQRLQKLFGVLAIFVLFNVDYLRRKAWIDSKTWSASSLLSIDFPKNLCDLMGYFGNREGRSLLMQSLNYTVFLMGLSHYHTSF